MTGRVRSRRRPITLRVAGLLVLGVVASSAVGLLATRAATTRGAPALLTINHADGARNVSPADPVTVDVRGGTLDTVELTTAGGVAVAGEFDDTRTSWASDMLKYGTAYTLRAEGTGEDGIGVEATRSFSTVKPRNQTRPYLWAWTRDTRQLDKAVNQDFELLDGHTYGVGQPIVTYFDVPIEDRAAAERTLKVTTSPPVLGSWHWMNSQEVRWRPREYWPAGTRVTVEADVYGRDLGGGLYGQENVSASFEIGPKKVAVADYETDHMKVYIDDVQVMQIVDPQTGQTLDISAGIPVSMGRDEVLKGDQGQPIPLKTREGPHYITLKYSSFYMNSCGFGLCQGSGSYTEVVPKSMRITYDGEFVHLRDWEPMAALGGWNSSHGCVNVGPAHIYWLFDSLGPGDVVDVVGSGRMDLKDDPLGDWGYSWAEWWQGSALNAAEPVLGQRGDG